MGQYVGSKATYFYNGQLLVGGLVYVYEPGQTSILKQIFSDANMSVELSNPVETDENGQVEIYFSGTALVRVEDSNGTFVTSADGVSAVGEGTGGGGGGSPVNIWTTYHGNAAGSPPSLPVGDGNGNGWARDGSLGTNWRAEKNEINVTDGVWIGPILLLGADGAPGANGVDGADGVSTILAFLSNEAHTFAADASGNVGSFAGGGGFYRVLQGLTDVTASTTFSVVAQNDCTVTINSAGQYAVTGMTADQATATFRASVFGQDLDRILSLSKSRAGTDGVDGSDGTNGTDGADAQTLRINSSSQSFLYDNSSGTPVPDPVNQSITFEAIKQNITAATVWSSSPTVTLTGTGDTRTLSINNFGANSAVTVTATADGQSDSVTVYRVQSGQNGTAPIFVSLNRYSSVFTDVGGTVDYSDATGEASFHIGDIVDNTLGAWSISVPAGDTAQINTTVNEFFIGPVGAFRITSAAGQSSTATITNTYQSNTYTAQFRIDQSLPPMAVGLSRTSLTGNRTGAGFVTTTTDVTAVVTGGVPPYSGSWVFVSGDASVVPTTPGSTTTTFNTTLAANEIKTAAYRYEATDSGAPLTANSSNVNIVLSSLI